MNAASARNATVSTPRIWNCLTVGQVADDSELRRRRRRVARRAQLLHHRHRRQRVVALRRRDAHSHLRRRRVEVRVLRCTAARRRRAWSFSSAMEPPEFIDAAAGPALMRQPAETRDRAPACRDRFPARYRPSASSQRCTCHAGALRVTARARAAAAPGCASRARAARRCRRSVRRFAAWSRIRRARLAEHDRARPRNAGKSMTLNRLPRMFASPRNQRCVSGTGTIGGTAITSPASDEPDQPALVAALKAQPRRFHLRGRLGGEPGGKLLLERPEVESGGARHSLLSSATPGSAERRDLGEQLVAVDRLDDVIARALPQPPDLVGFLAFRRAHDHGDRFRLADRG